MKLILESPPEGYAKEAEYRKPNIGEFHIADSTARTPYVMQCDCEYLNQGNPCRIVLTPIKPPAKPPAEPWDQQTALTAIRSGVWFRRPNMATVLMVAVGADQTGLCWGGGGVTSYPQLAEYWEHCHVQVPNERTQWYPCTKQGYKDSEIPF